ncbi:MAG: proline--tRNA ligase [Planctomycetota bacterium]|jgi:prolyl-tRNA synthetase|nr:proline--tRNA ligase [Planctomycetota bacterium]
MPPATAITPTREQDYPEWYQQVVRAAELAENSAVRGCMVIKPWGYALWENMRGVLDKMFRATGHQNAYFPLFIPLSFFEKEAAHVEGFAKECAVVTHHRLEADGDGKLKPVGVLDEPLIVRPTSETIIGATYAKWVQSYRDLPILINQWANVVRWEMRTRLFLRTAEFLWQEGHTVHETEKEAWEETRKMLEVYRDFAENYLAMPVITGEKTAGERFPGAVATLCIEAMMQDRKALQAGTSHFLGQNFARASGIQFQNREGKIETAWTTSWGVSTRLIGGLIMTHADDNGLIMPPRVAPEHIVVLPIIRADADREKVLAYCEETAARLREQIYDGAPVRAVIDRRDLSSGDKGWQWVKKGVPLRVEIGLRDVEKDGVFVGIRNREKKEGFSRAEFIARTPEILATMQREMFAAAKKFRADHTREIDDLAEFEQFFTPQNADKPEVHGGFALSPWCGGAVCEQRANAQKITIRCLPLAAEKAAGKCVFCGNASQGRAVFAKAY